MSKIYLVNRTDDHKGYDEYYSHVVVAKSQGQARQLCSEKAVDEGSKIWLADTTTTTVIGYPRADTPRIVLSDFNAG